MKIVMTIEAESTEEAQNILEKLGSLTVEAIDPNQTELALTSDAANVFGEAPKPPAPETNQVAAAVEEQELDAGGYPWDERINVTSKTKLKSGPEQGFWKRKRGIDDAYVQKIRSEIKPEAEAPPAPAPEATEAPKPPATPPAPETTEAPKPPAPVPPTPEASKPTGGAMTFPQLVEACGALGIDKEAKDKAAAELGLASFPYLAARPDLIPEMAKKLLG